MPRPLKSFGGFVGQRTAVHTLERLAEASLKSGRPVPHLALVGAAGVGKTTLVRALASKLANVATEPASNLHVVIAGPGALMSLHERICSAQFGDIVFVDEAHALDENAAELLFPVVDCSKIVGVNERGRLERNRLEPVAPLTIVAATNEPGRLNKALRTRLLILELTTYSIRELTVITREVASERGLALTPQAARELAESSNGTPRSIEQLVGLLAAVQTDPRPLTQGEVRAQLREFLGIDEDTGLTVNQTRALRVLECAGGRARADFVRCRLGLDAAYVRQDVEHGLVERGLLEVRSDGIRELTDAGRDLVRRSELGIASDTDDTATPTPELAS